MVFPWISYVYQRLHPSGQAALRPVLPLSNGWTVGSFSNQQVTVWDQDGPPVAKSAPENALIYGRIYGSNWFKRIPKGHNMDMLIYDDVCWSMVQISSTDSRKGKYLQQPMLLTTFFFKLSKFPADFPSNQNSGNLHFPIISIVWICFQVWQQQGQESKNTMKHHNSTRMWTIAGILRIDPISQDRNRTLQSTYGVLR